MTDDPCVRSEQTFDLNPQRGLGPLASLGRIAIPPIGARMMRVVRVLVAPAGFVLALAVPALAAVRTGTYAMRGVSFVVTPRSIEHFKINVVYFCGPQGKQGVTKNMKLSGIALRARGAFHLKMDGGRWSSP
jgi:hypothetical protein